ncbi:MAG: YegS/Rv2252/BmrU family lipid kinase, partial [Oscillospiraceae bacterium]|nr:YegS/Rv2252/BmrU family lipid kinase [Oscillospiraceae bacterium]
MDGNELLLIVNPVAGKGQSKSALFGVLSELCAGGRAVTVRMTDAAGSARRLTAACGADYGTVACVGGDGTLSEIIAGVLELPRERRPHIGYIPMGTTNDMASTFAISRVPEEAARKVLTGRPRSVDVGRLNGKSFGYVAAFGAFTEVSYATPQDMKKTFGHLAYVLEGAASVPSIKPYHVRIEHDGGETEGDFLYGGVTNSLSLGGLVKLAPDAVDLSDGEFELLLVRAPKTPIDLNKALL